MTKVQVANLFVFVSASDASPPLLLCRRLPAEVSDLGVQKWRLGEAPEEHHPHLPLAWQQGKLVAIRVSPPHYSPTLNPTFKPLNCPLAWRDEKDKPQIDKYREALYGRGEKKAVRDEDLAKGLRLILESDEEPSRYTSRSSKSYLFFPSVSNLCGVFPPESWRLPLVGKWWRRWRRFQRGRRGREGQRRGPWILSLSWRALSPLRSW